MIVRDSTARGIGVAVPGVEIFSNRIARTNCAGIIWELMGGGNASGVFIACNLIFKAGQLEKGDIASEML